MAASAFLIVKQGDVYRLSYYAKNGNTGLTDITAKVRNPSGAGTTIPWDGTDPTAGFCEMGDGWYYHDWNSTAKAYGVWHFLIDSTSKKAEAPTRIAVVDGDSLDDTPFEKLDTMLDTALSELQNATYGLSALEQRFDGVEGVGFDSADSLTAIKDYLVNTIYGAITSIKNNVDSAVAIPDVVLIPETGSVTRRIHIDVYNSSGGMEDPDDNQIQVKVYDHAGTDVTTTYLAGTEPIYMTRDAIGQYHIDFTVASTATPTELTFKFSYLENTVAKVRHETCRLATSDEDITAKLDAIETKVTDLQGTGFVSANDSNKAISTAVAGLGTKIDGYLADGGTIETLIDDIESILNSDVKGTGFASATDSLHAIRTAMDGYLANGGTIDVLIDSIIADVSGLKGTGYDEGVDSLKKISDRLQAVQGAGWDAGTDTLEKISDYVQPGGIAF